VTIFEADAEIGGQFRLARRVPGKQEFDEALRYWSARLDALGIDRRMGRRANVDDLAGFDAVVLATGVRARRPDIPGIDRANVLGYAEALGGARPIGRRVAIIGAGGIGFDVALALVEKGGRAHLDPAAFAEAWGIDRTLAARGGLAPAGAKRHAPAHEVVLCQRKSGKVGASLGRSTGWIHRLTLQKAGARILDGVSYRGIDDAGLHVVVGGEARTVSADTVIVCAGQESVNELEAPLRSAGREVRVVGGARLAGELDAKRAIEEGHRAAMAL
jgi:2,4-dienoyl-CoA reductase (NADPH2)